VACVGGAAVFKNLLHFLVEVVLSFAESAKDMRLQHSRVVTL
jgi:hypothetical protein